MKTLTHTFKGKEIKLFPVSAFADMINRDRQTIKRWEREGMIPKAPFTKKHGDKNVRLYPEYFIKAVKTVVRLMKIRKGATFDKIIVKRKIFTEIEKQKEKL